MSLQPETIVSLFERVRMGVGTWAWGDTLFWGYGHDYSHSDVQAAFQACIETGLLFFDTAETYGQGRSERNLGELIQSTQAPVTIATKFMPYPWRLSSSSLQKSLRTSLERLGLKTVDLYQVHWPFPPMSIEFWMEAMAHAYEDGLIRAVGVSNFNQDQVQRSIEVLARYHLPLASNQIEFHLLNRSIEKNGMLSLCKQKGVTVIAYSPLAQGLLSGKYTPENPPSGIRAYQNSKHYLRNIQPLISLMRGIGSNHGGKTPAQVAINWIICKGAVPIPGVKTAAQVFQNAGALNWQLADDEVTDLDRASDLITTSR